MGDVRGFSEGKVFMVGEGGEYCRLSVLAAQYRSNHPVSSSPNFNTFPRQASASYAIICALVIIYCRLHNTQFFSTRQC
jgi:hypothetical protein